MKDPYKTTEKCSQSRCMRYNIIHPNHCLIYRDITTCGTIGYSTGKMNIKEHLRVPPLPSELNLLHEIPEPDDEERLAIKAAREPLLSEIVDLNTVISKQRVMIELQQDMIRNHVQGRIDRDKRR